MLIAIIVIGAISVYGIAYTVLSNRHNYNLILNVSQIVDRNFATNDTKLEEIKRLQSIIARQEHWIALLWSQTYGTEPADKFAILNKRVLRKVDGRAPDWFYNDDDYEPELRRS